MTNLQLYASEAFKIEMNGNCIRGDGNKLKVLKEFRVGEFSIYNHFEADLFGLLVLAHIKITGMLPFRDMDRKKDSHPLCDIRGNVNEASEIILKNSIPTNPIYTLITNNSRKCAYSETIYIGALNEYYYRSRGVIPVLKSMIYRGEHWPLFLHLY